MEASMLLHENDLVREEPIVLTSPNHPKDEERIFLSNIDQTVAFPVETLYFFKSQSQSTNTISGLDHIDIAKRVMDALEELLVPYYFLAGRLYYSVEENRLELVCNNSGALFRRAESSLRLDELGDVSLPNSSFQLLVLRVNSLDVINGAPVFTIQVTTFKCGGFSIGISTSHSILDGKSAIDMFQNLASLCRGHGFKTLILYNDRTCLKARNPRNIRYPHSEYIKLSDFLALSASSFTSQFSHDLSSMQTLPKTHVCKLFTFTEDMIKTLKNKANPKTCSSFVAMVAQLWRARSFAVFGDDEDKWSSTTSTVLFAVDIRKKVCPNLPDGFIGNAVITAFADAKVEELKEEPFAFLVERIEGAIERVSDDYVKSAIDWLEVYKGVPCTVGGSFYVSAWWKLPFHELDFGYGELVHGGPVVSGMCEFVLLLGNKKGGINMWVVLEKEQMKRFEAHIYDM